MLQNCSAGATELFTGKLDLPASKTVAPFFKSTVYSAELIVLSIVARPHWQVRIVAPSHWDVASESIAPKVLRSLTGKFHIILTVS